MAGIGRVRILPLHKMLLVILSLAATFFVLCRFVLLPTHHVQVSKDTVYLKFNKRGKTRNLWPDDFLPKDSSNQASLNSLMAVNQTVQTISSLQPMAMALDYWEQMGNAMNNFIDLQCWAETVGITKVMEPHVLNNGLAFDFTFNSKLTFRDLFDIDAWNSMSVNNSFSSLVSPQTFVNNAVKEMVFVQFIYTSFGRQCKSMDKIMSNKWYEVLNSKGFHIVDKVCIDFKKEPNNNTMTQEAFRERIFGKVGNKVSVIFFNWHGIRDYNDITVRHECTFRIPITGTRCSGVMYKMVELVSSKPSSVKYAHINHPSPLIPSKRVSSYVKQFKTDFMSGTDYIAVMLRSEKLEPNLLSTHSSSGVNPCMINIISDWKRMTSALRTNNSMTLFFSDIGGGHGSLTWGNDTARLLSNRVEDSLKVERTLKAVNRYLEKITGSQNSVLIAVIHREIIAQAKCAIVVGGGTFQKQTLNMFSHYHKGVGELCYSFRNSSCVPNYIDFVYDNLYYRG